jgi:hypothetical protein
VPDRARAVRILSSIPFTSFRFSSLVCVSMAAAYHGISYLGCIVAAVAAMLAGYFVAADSTALVSNKLPPLSLTLSDLIPAPPSPPRTPRQRDLVSS